MRHSLNKETFRDCFCASAKTEWFVILGCLNRDEEIRWNFFCFKATRLVIKLVRFFSRKWNLTTLLGKQRLFLLIDFYVTSKSNMTFKGVKNRNIFPMWRLFCVFIFLTHLLMYVFSTFWRQSYKRNLVLE